jgi:hypothetical protein
LERQISDLEICLFNQHKPLRFCISFSVISLSLLGKFLFCNRLKFTYFFADFYMQNFCYVLTEIYECFLLLTTFSASLACFLQVLARTREGVARLGPQNTQEEPPNLGYQNPLLLLSISFIVSIPRESLGLAFFL